MRRNCYAKHLIQTLPFYSFIQQALDVHLLDASIQFCTKKSHSVITVAAIVAGCGTLNPEPGVGSQFYVGPTTCVLPFQF